MVPGSQVVPGGQVVREAPSLLPAEYKRIRSKPNKASPRSYRLFLALWPDDTVRLAVGEHAAAWILPPQCLRYGPADWHVTLHFLGSVAADRVPDVGAAVLDVALEPFELVLDRPRIWPRGLAVLCASSVPLALASLHERLGKALVGAGLALEDRPYRPHLTLARRAESAIVPPVPMAVVWPVQRFSLVVSTGRAEHRYEVLREYG